MKLSVGVFVLACALAITAAQQYTNKFDNVNVDEVLGNPRILTSYIKCLNEKGPCTAEGRELKKLLPDALATDCSKCTPIQNKNSMKVINYLRQHRADEWNVLLKKYDPKGIYRAKHGV